MEVWISEHGTVFSKVAAAAAAAESFKPGKAER
jgi:hypothetical protein